MRQEIHKVRSLTGKPFSVNVLPVQNGEDIYTPPMLKVIYEEKIPVVTFVGEPDEKMFHEFKEHEIKIVYRSLNPTPENARLAEKFAFVNDARVTVAILLTFLQDEVVKHTLILFGITAGNVQHNENSQHCHANHCAIRQQYDR